MGEVIINGDVFKSALLKKFYCFLRSLKSLIVIFKNILELEKWTNRNQEFT